MHFRNQIKTKFSLNPPTKLIIDTHGGIQDILAIVFAQKLIWALGTGQQIIGITCVSGKHSIEDAIKSALVANKLLGTKIAVFKGQKQSLMLKTQYPKTYGSINFSHLQQTLYKQIDSDTNIHGLVQKQKAVDFIIRSCSQHKDNLGIIAFGPLTNLGLAHRLQNCLTQVKMLSVTGGQYMGIGNTVKGNIQANFAHDPLAAHIIFQTKIEHQYLQNKIYVNVLEKTLQYSIKPAIYQCQSSQHLQQKYSHIFQNMGAVNSININCGPILTILPFIQPQVVQNKHYVYVQIIRDGGVTDGLFAINWLKVGAKQGQYQSFVYLYQDYDYDKVNELFIKAFTFAQNSK